MALIGLLATLLVAATLTGGVPARADVAEKATEGPAFTGPNPNEIKKDGTCIAPTFGWYIYSTEDEAVFSGTVRIVGGGKTYYKASAPNFSINRQQKPRVTKPVCKAGKYSIVLKGYVQNQITQKNYKKIAASRTYAITQG